MQCSVEDNISSKDETPNIDCSLDRNPVAEPGGQGGGAAPPLAPWQKVRGAPSGEPCLHTGRHYWCALFTWSTYSTLYQIIGASFSEHSASQATSKKKVIDMLKFEYNNNGFIILV